MLFTEVYKNSHRVSAHSLWHILLAGQSNPPNHLSMFLEVTDSKAGSSEWSCFVSHRLSVVNQKFEGDRLGHLLPSCICIPKNICFCLLGCTCWVYKTFIECCMLSGLPHSLLLHSAFNES